MKLKSILMAVFTFVLACSLVVFGKAQLKASAATVDISDNITFTDWADEAELKYINIVFGEGALNPDINYGVMDDVNFNYIQDYIEFNGRTAREINEDTTLGAADWTYTVFPSSADAKYKVPVMIYESSGMQLRFKIHRNYFAMLGTEITVTVKAGLELVNGETTSVISRDVSHTYVLPSVEEVDISSDITATGWDVTGSASELMYTRLSFGAGVLPAEIDYGIMDADYQFIQEYITINGRTVKEINEQTDVSSYTFSTFPSNASDIYKVPVIIYVNGETLEIKVHNDYITSLGNITNVVIGVESGLTIENAGVVYKVENDVLIIVWGESEIAEIDITSELSVTSWITQSEYKVTYLNVGGDIISDSIDYGVTSGSHTYVQDYIFINGRSVKEINADATLGSSEWEYTIFPASADDKYKLPVILFAKTDSIEIKIHSEYVKLLGNRVEITAKAGLYIEETNVKYVVTQDTSFVAWEQIVLEEVDILENVSVSLWITQSEYKVTYLNLGENVIPEGVNYDVTSGSHVYVQEYILINGRSVKEINADTTLGASEWEYTIFPASADDKYKLPIILFAKTDCIEIKVHSSLIALLGESLEITLKSDFYMENGNYKYVVSKDVEYVLSSKTWADKNKKNKITYYLNGEQYGDVEEVLHNSPLLLRDDPEIPSGYFFSGWEYPPTNGVVSDMEIQGYIRPIEYTITYNLNGGVNDPQNPISYYVTDGEVVLNPATKDGATFAGWYTSSDYTTKVEKLTPSDLCDVVLYAKFEEDSTAKKGCKSSIFDGSALALVLCLGVVAFRLKKKD